MRKIILLLALSAFYAVCVRAANLTVGHLQCEYQDNPGAVDATSPRLGWSIVARNAAVRGERQTAYQVCVATSLKLLKGNPDVWDSGRTTAEAAPYIEYGGAPLRTATTYYWRVRVWDKDGKASAWSAPAKWTMGILTPSEWKAQWIGAPWDGEAARQTADSCTLCPAPLLRKTFRIGKKVASAKAFVSGLGYFELYVNGRKVSDDVLSPNQTNYSHRDGLDNKVIPILSDFSRYRVMYVGYDITSLLRTGDNAVGCILGNGFFNSVKHWVAGFGSPRFIGQIEITYTDGTHQTIVSDQSWQAHESAIRFNDIYGGEIYDASHAMPGWATAHDTSAGWRPVALRQAPTGAMKAQDGPADRVVRRIEPVSIRPMGDGRYEVDFGEEVSGWVRLSGIDAQRGDTLTVTYESESPNGRSVYVADGSGDESYATRFTWYVFRKAIVSGWHGQLEARNLRAEVVHSAVERASAFECSNDLLNKIYDIWLRTQLDNMHGSVASDCPHRERSAYTGDGQVSSVMVMHSLDTRSFYGKWIHDMLDAQLPTTGYVPNAAPWQPACGGGVPWGAAVNIMPWEYYLHYGDKRMLADSYDVMMRHLDYMATWRTPDGTMRSEEPRGGEKNYWMNLGEWCQPFEMPDDELVHTFYWWRCTQLTAKAARALGRDADATRLEQQCADIRAAFIRKFYDARKGSFGRGGSDVFALVIGLDGDMRQRVVQSLRDEIASHDNHLMTGIFGTQFLFETLAHNGLNDLAYEMLSKTTYPSYGHWIAQGSTTTWERWDGKDSHNHPMFGGGLVWFYRSLCGVNADEATPAYKHFTVSPLMPRGLDHASCSLDTPYGQLSSAWSRTATGYELRVKVPVGCSATVALPDVKASSAVRESGVEVSKARGVAADGASAAAGRYTVQSGEYRFEVTL